jgi:hypothetical protein
MVELIISVDESATAVAAIVVKN